MLIGRTGVGKTHLLNHMSRALVESNADAAEEGAFSIKNEGLISDRPFAGLVSVTFIGSRDSLAFANVPQVT